MEISSISRQYQTIYAGFNAAAADYTYNDYFKIGVTCMVVAIVVVLVVANLSMNKKAAHLRHRRAGDGKA